MALSELDHALLSAIAYAGNIDEWPEGGDLQEYICWELENDGDLCIPPDDGRWITEEEWRAMLAAAFITMAGAVRYAGARLSDAATAAAGIFASFVELPWNQIRAWVLDAIQGARGLYKSIGPHAGRPRAAAPGLSSSGSKVYDFSPARLEELRAAHEHLMSMRLDSRPNWESRYGGAAFMGRLSLDPVQERIAGALEAERSAGEEVVEKASEAFRRAEAEDRRYAGELASMASAARSAAALLA